MGLRLAMPPQPVAADAYMSTVHTASCLTSASFVVQGSSNIFSPVLRGCISTPPGFDHVPCSRIHWDDVPLRLAATPGIRQRSGWLDVNALANIDDGICRWLEWQGFQEQVHEMITWQRDPRPCRIRWGTVSKNTFVLRIYAFVGCNIGVHATREICCMVFRFCAPNIHCCLLPHLGSKVPWRGASYDMKHDWRTGESFRTLHGHCMSCVPPRFQLVSLQSRALWHTVTRCHNKLF